ncbi:MAG: HD domain-containing protein [Deltaproteobacteria bacterium]|jgi:3'-5' exoribonuclease|nr:HD domain-containing protein [Deltaproteobacteria bacterium]
MKKTQFIKDIVPGDDVDALFLLGAAALHQARNGPFWRLELKDASGTLEAKIWSPQSQEYAGLAAGQIVEVQGRSGMFRDQAQIAVDRLRPLSPEETSACDLALFLPASPRPAPEMLEELENLCRLELTHAPWKKFVLAVLRHADIRPRLLTAPAAKSVHHAYVGGLLEHTLSVAGLALRLADHYPELDRQILLAAAVCHDLGKIWELTGGLANDYSDAGRLLGHTVLGLERLEPFLQEAGLAPELARHFKHLLLSHHGEHQYGSPQLPQTAEAFALHYADNIDAKVAQCRHIFSAFAEDGSGWSSYQTTLGRFMHRPARTPKSAAPESDAQRKPAKENQCSLLSKE